MQQETTKTETRLTFSASEAERILSILHKVEDHKLSNSDFWFWTDLCLTMKEAMDASEVSTAN